MKATRFHIGYLIALVICLPRMARIVRRTLTWYPVGRLSEREFSSLMNSPLFRRDVDEIWSVIERWTGSLNRDRAYTAGQVDPVEYDVAAVHGRGAYVR